jgi:hypothetical protein
MIHEGEHPLVGWSRLAEILPKCWKPSKAKKIGHGLCLGFHYAVSGRFSHCRSRNEMNVNER